MMIRKKPILKSIEIDWDFLLLISYNQMKAGALRQDHVRVFIDDSS